MSFDNPLDATVALGRGGCGCGRHATQAEHDAASTGSSDARLSRVVESAVVRALFPRGWQPPGVPARGRRLDGAGRHLAVLPARHGDRGVRAGRGAGEEGPQGRVHPDHLRHAHHHGAPDGLLHQARAQRGGGEDRRLGRHPRQDPQQGIRRRPHALADAARHHAGRRLQPDPLHHAGGGEHQRPGHHARHQAQGQARSQELEGLQVRRAVRLLDAQLPAALLRGRARHRPRHRHPDPRHPAARDGGESACRQHRRLPRARSRQPARGLRRRRLHPRAVEGHLGPAPLLRIRRLEGVRDAVAQHLRGAAEGDHRRHGLRRQAREPQADRRGHRAAQLPQPAGDRGRAGADRHLRRRPRQRADRAGPHRLRSLPLGVVRGVDHDADEALGPAQGRRRLCRRRQAGVPRHRHGQAHEGGRPDAARRHLQDLQSSWARSSIRPSPRTTSRASPSSARPRQCECSPTALASPRGGVTATPGSPHP